MADETENDSLRVIARCLAFLCLKEADVRDKDLASQAKFLEGLGVHKRDAAGILGTSEDSLGVLLRRAQKKKGKKNAIKGKKAK